MTPECRHCGSPLRTSFCDLGMSPLANSYVPMAEADRMEPFYPLHAYVCGTCFLVQLQDFETAENIFSEDYAYYSSFSDSWVEHARRYVEMMIGRFGFDANSQVIEIASNDGYLLQFFKQAGVPCFGIEPAANAARIAEETHGIPSITAFFGEALGKQLAGEGKQADLLLGNNVLAHVPDINDFVRGLKLALNPGGVITFEFPHLLKLIEFNQFDTIYHEHFSYLALGSVETVFGAFGLKLFDVEEVPTHGGSLRIFATHAENDALAETDRLAALRATEAAARLTSLEAYTAYSAKVMATKRGLLKFLMEAKESGKSIVGYGAPAKGNTLLNYCGVGTDFIDYTVDRNPEKQNRLLPGTRIPIHAPERIAETKPDYLLILPWNLKDEIAAQMSQIRDWGGRFVTPIPEVEVF
ncbi:MAG: class I SAM-dependent methyltransferase [Rhodobacter sp.]|nr:class I SAM-dependent methyltransferase [Rhodobacter sp.]